MKSKKLTLISASALAAGMAHGAVTYTYLNQTIGVSGNLPFDLNQDGYPDYTIKFDNNNNLKPYVDDSVGLASPNTVSAVLSDAVDGTSSQGLPLTPAGVSIDAGYESIQSFGYFYEDANANVVGGWLSGGANIEGYVGLELQDGGGNSYFGWARFVYNSTNLVNGVAGSITLVDYAFETQTGVGILAGQTAESNTPPAIAFISPSQTNYVGGTAQFTVAATGNPQPIFQWVAGAVGSGLYTNLVDSSKTAGSTSGMLSISNLASADGADYAVILSNASGSVTNSIPITLTVAPLIINGLSPAPVELYVGSKVSIVVRYSSSIPINSFQWLKDSVNLSDGGRISGSSSANLVISSLSTNDNGNYSVVLNNNYGSVTSRMDVLTAVVPSVPYQEEVISLHPVVYYSFSETNNPSAGNLEALDLVSGLNGTYGTNTQNGFINYNIAGPRPTDNYLGFTPQNTALAIISPAQVLSSLVTIPALNLNTNTVTFTAWINPQQTESAYASIISFRGAVSGTANGVNYDPAADGLGYHWNDNGNTYNYASMLLPPPGTWSFVALVIAPTNATFYLFNAQNGMLTATNNFANIVQALNTPGFFGGDTHDPNFIGNMDEVAIFNQSLSMEQLTNLYNVAVTGILPILPPPVVVVNISNSAGNCTINWNPPVGTLLQASAITGPWTTNLATSPYTFTPGQAQMYYRVKAQ